MTDGHSSPLLQILPGTAVQQQSSRMMILLLLRIYEYNNSPLLMVVGCRRRRFRFGAAVSPRTFALSHLARYQ